MQRQTRVYVNLGLLAVFGLTVVAAFVLTLGRESVFDARQDVFAELEDTGGLVPSHQVTLLGHKVGEIYDIDLTAGGVRLHVKVDEDAHVPERAVAQIIRRSAVGEQTLNLIPVATDWEPPEGRLIPRLLEPSEGWEAATPGSRLDLAAIAYPADLHDVLENAEELFLAVDKSALSTTVRELAAAVGGRGETLVDLNRQTFELNETLVSAIPDFERLLETTEEPLEALRDHRDELADMVSNLAEVSDILAENRPTLEGLIEDGTATLRTFDGFVRDNRPNLTCLVGDVHDLSGVTVDNLHWVAQLLDLNTYFWDTWDRSYQWDPWRPGILWQRMANITFGEETGRAYEVRRPTPATRPGAACTGAFGPGVGPVRQPDHQPPDPTSPGIDWAPRIAASGPAGRRTPMGSPTRTSPETPATGPSGPIPHAAIAVLLLAWAAARRSQ